MDNAARPLYNLRTAASRVGLSPRTLRLYEEAGLLAPARTGGNAQRLYSEQDLRWLRCIRDMIHSEGLTVAAIRRLLDLIPCWEVHHCSPEQALLCAPQLNIPGMARASSNETVAPLVASDGKQTPSGVVEVKLIYGVEEFGAILPCSRCVQVERVVRKVAARHGDEVAVTKLDILSDEAEQYGVILPPTVVVNDEVLAVGQGVSEARLEKAIEKHRPSAGLRPVP